MRLSWNLYIIICVLALGAVFEILKTAHVKQPSNMDADIKISEDELRPYSRKENSQNHRGEQQRRENLQKIAQINSQFKGGSTDSTLTPPSSDSIPGKNQEVNDSDDKNVKKLNELVKKTTAEMNRKKKTAAELKRKKAEAERKARLDAMKKKKDQAGDPGKNPKSEEDKDLSPPDTQVNGPYSEVPPASPISANDPNEDNDIPDAQEWMRRVLNQPSLEETNAMIKYRQSNLITPEVFYYIVQQMVEDSRERMRELGIQAANATPSYRSLIILAQFLQNEPHGSALRAKATSALERYTEYSYLAVIESVYRSNEKPLIREKALSLLIESAQRNLHSKTSSSTTTPTENSEQEVKNPHRQQYADLLSGLETMLNNPRESTSISLALQSTVDALKELLKST